jgi:hypothetical protein
MKSDQKIYDIWIINMIMIKYDRIYGGFIDVILFGDHVDCGLFFLDLPYLDAAISANWRYCAISHRSLGV